MKYILLFLLSAVLSTSLLAARVDTVWVQSNAMNKQVPCVVIVPEAKTESTTSFPVVYLLHGYSGNYRSWVVDFPSVIEDADRYGILIVCPDGGYSSWYFDSPLDSAYKYETFVSRELVNYVDTHYNTIADRAHRGISGLSMGGHGAFYLAFKHKDIYGAVNSMSGGVDFRAFPNNWDISKRIGAKAAYPGNWENYTVINLVHLIKKGDLKIAFDCGVKDFFIEGNRAFHKTLHEAGIDHDYTERPGVHNGVYWANSVRYHLLFFHLFFFGK